MSEVERIQDQLRKAFHGDAWHGPSLREVLDGVTAAQASSRLATGHSIREMVLHITAWTDISCQRLAVTPVPEATTEEDWPQVDGLDEADWKEDLENHLRYRRTIAGATEELS